MCRTIILFLGIFFTLTSIAQTIPEEYQQAYQKGERAIREKKYEQAREYFAPLTSSRYQNELVPYSHYFMALASLKSNKLAESRSYLRQLETRYPKWNKIDEARYLYANILFEEKQYIPAVDALKRLPDSRITEDARTMENYYLSQCTDISTLKQLNAKYSTDPVIAENLVYLIRKRSSSKADLDLADKLINRFSIKPKAIEKAITEKKPTVNVPAKGKKQSYNVAVLFPFRLNELGTSNNSNQFIIDLYDGIQMAVKKLQKESVTINIQAYEVDNSEASMKRLIGNEPFQQTDLLIGPLYPISYEIASAWAAERNIPIVNPISTNSSLLKNLTYLTQPSTESQAKALLQFANRFTPKTTYITYGSSRQDSLLAVTYASLAKENGFKILGLKRGLSETITTDLKGQKPGHILALYQNSGPSVMSWYNKSTLPSPLLVSYQSFNMATASAYTFKGPQVYFFDSMYANDAEPVTLEFRQQYLNTYNLFPSTYAYLGYDTMLFFGRMLGKFGSDFTKGAHSQAYTNGYTLGGFDYRQSNDNQNFTILKFSNYQFIPVK
ncbi:hypothetical protein BWI96_19715 [Siphonobacter sp. SORGH_AS_0500]|uniref:ABC transporter substrate-binding protein n=1 Tax=Siphonobacter sp. SORGH_AS_0500 TaxID=1864824 RepID=UPI000CA92C31|nr:ABC transporter substrate-binding protein [Siphonobacter sp. SORGH_AS_0500]PKK34948.1 hypothetical protein BWI96_19715 [Siphonobacter sp. SORGH_AS_0500]